MEIDWECGCEACTGNGPAENDVHDDDCGCFECHDSLHAEPEQWASVCIYCDEVVLDWARQEEAERGNGKCEEAQKVVPELREGEGSRADGQ